MAPTFAAKAAAGASLLHHLKLLTPVILMFYLAALPSLADSLPIQRKFMPDDQSFSETSARTHHRVGVNNDHQKQQQQQKQQQHHRTTLQLMLPQWYEEFLKFKYQTGKVIGKSAEFHGNNENVVEERRKTSSQRKRKKECREELVNKNKSKLIKERRRRKRRSDVVNSVHNLNLRKVRNSEKIWENFKYNLSESSNEEDRFRQIVLLKEASKNFTSTTTTPIQLDKETVESRKGNGEFCLLIIREFKDGDL